MISFQPNNGVEVNLFPVTRIQINHPSSISYAGELVEGDVPLFFRDIKKLDTVKMTAIWVNKTVIDTSITYDIVDYLQMKSRYGILEWKDRQYTVILDLEGTDIHAQPADPHSVTLSFQIVEEII